MPVVYLTGAPATGKSTLGRNLEKLPTGALLFSYSLELRKLIASRRGEELTEDVIRARSSGVVTENDIRDLDELLIKLVGEQRANRSIVIDSHAVTKESYGFRVTSFSVDQLRTISPDYIVCLYASSCVIAQRIDANAMGRPTASQFEVDMHTSMQCQLAIEYGVLVGRPVYLFDSAINELELAEVVARKCRLLP